MDDEIKVATFDCYGTLIDWEGGLGAFLYDLARRKGDERPEPGRVLRERWEELQFERLDGPYRRYREILAASLSAWCSERGYLCGPEDGEALARSMETWQPFPDTVPALRAAREAGLRLWIVSNTDRAIVEHTLRQLELDFDGVTVAEDVRAYKPSRAPFEAALQQIGEAPERVLHVAFGFKYDIGTAMELGMRTAWINRGGEKTPAGALPDAEWTDLWSLANLAKS
jgi:2-haloacid dehalogenase